MGGRDRRQEEEMHHQQLGQSGGAGDESPVLGIPANVGAEISAEAPEPLNTGDNVPAADDDDDGSEFEFAFASNLPTITATDEIFSEGRIRPIYPVFDRGLFLYYQSQAADAALGEDQRDPTPLRLPLRDLMQQQQQRSTEASTSGGRKATGSSVDGASSSATTSSGTRLLARASSFSSSDADDLEGVPADTYCVWTPGSVPPSPEHLGRKSRSTGSTGIRRWRLRDLVLGRSHSDGRSKLMFFQHDGGEGEAKSSVAGMAGSSKPVEEEDGSQGKKKTGKKSNDNKEEGKNKGDKKDGCSCSSKDHSKASPAAANQRKKKPTAVAELDLATAHRLYYNNNNSLKSGGSAAAASAHSQGQRRSSSTFLPYRKDLFVGIFPHARSPSRGLGLGFQQAPSSFYGF